MTKSGKDVQEGATIKPGEFPLGSIESRAAARALADKKETDVVRINLMDFSWGPDHPEKLISRSSGQDGQEIEVWRVPYGGPSWEDRKKGLGL